ncbi:MAG: carboxypeptidase-like regulatory domain-containing protein [Thermoplasmata archaeon]|nr:carboxypeptidase-like regulatory domain-containing protein [Thermoplasmata archaeon]MCI4359205.1 carboxypeptidase-like regulatory domain-containing protein [Thermoplasmata archaeon]
MAGASTATTHPNAPAVPAANTYRTAIFKGFVHDARSGAVIDGANVQPESQGGICPNSPGNCTSDFSRGTTGNFTVRGPAPQTTLFVSENGYLDNFTTVSNVTPGMTYNVGIINLSKEGRVSGLIQGSDPTHELVTCTVLVSVVSRSALTLGSNETVSNGKFNVAVPPFPSIISFDPKCPQYLGNQYWVNVSAYSQVNFGAAYLPVNVVVQANIYDAVTKRSLNGQLSEIQICSYTSSGNCGPKGKTVTSGSPKAWGPPGYDVITAWAIAGNGEPGMLNVSMIGYVPALAPGHVFRAPNIYVGDLGMMYIGVGLTFDRQLIAQKVLSKWGVGMAVITPTTLDGYTSWSFYNPMTGNFSTGGPPSTCVNIGALGLIFVPPLRSQISIAPDTAASCFPPVPTWPVPTGLPAWGNRTLVNATPDNRYYTPVGWVNLTPGTYVEGAIYGNSALPVGGQSLISIAAATTDQTADAQATTSYTTYVSAQPAPPNHPGFSVAGCPAGSWVVFCAPVPFGPSKMTFTSPTVINSTWIDVTPGYYTSTGPLLIQTVDTAPLVHVSLNGVVVSTGGVGAAAFNNASISGRLVEQGSGIVPYGLVNVVVKLAGTSPAQESQSTCSADPLNGLFTCSANPGWNVVTASSPLYLTNSTWVDVVGATAQAHAGTIDLTPLTTIQGQVVTGNGAGILQASAQYCPIASGTSASCSSLGTTGTTNSFGQYSGMVAPYPLPRGAYKLIFAATGFTSNWTWVNATIPGGIINASTITLYSQSSPSAVQATARAAAGPTPIAAEWAVGNVVDNATGLPVQGLTMQWQNPGGPALQVGGTDINALDDFNTSITTGIVYVNFTAIGYLPASLYINVTGLDQSAVDYLPTVTMQPETFFTGRVEIGPGNWSVLSTSLGLGPGATSVTGCTRTLICGSAETINEGGFFNVSAPTAPNQYEILKIQPQGKPVGSASGEFLSTVMYANFSGTPTVVEAAVPGFCNIFGVVLAQVHDASTNNSTPVRWPTATLQNGVGTVNITTMIAGSGGALYAITQSSYGKNSISVTAAATAYTQNRVKNGTVDWGQTDFIGNLSLNHFGWVAGAVFSTVGHNVSVPWATAMVSTWSGTPPLNLSTSGSANGAGYLNLSVSPGNKGTIIVTAPDYNSTNASGFTVNQSMTDTVSVLLKNHQGGLTPWGWVRGSVNDTAFHFPLTLAQVDITSRYGAVGTQVDTNGMGLYFIDAPPGPAANVSINLTDYTGNFTRVSVPAGAVSTARSVNLTGDGIVAGYVQSYPQGLPVAFANVSLCSQARPLCSNTVVANGSGFFWIAGPPGFDNLTVSYNNFVTTFRPVNVTSDTWIWVGTVKLDEYAFLSGTVIGLPSGIPVEGANVSACSPLAFSEGAVICAYATQTSATGQFFMAVPADNYIIQVNATLYNTTFLPLQLLPGETVSMGLIELEQYGIAVGFVFGQDTQGPLAGALVTACPTWQVGNCTSVSTNRVSGQYLFEGPPGPYAVTAGAPNYDKAGETVLLVSGSLVHAPTIYLEPIGPAYRFSIQGTVLAQSTAPGGALFPFAGAVVADNVGDAATTDTQGVFHLSVLWGDLVITVTANGYQAAQLHEQVRGNITGVSITLVPMTYRWTGFVTDGINRQALNGVVLTLGLGGITVATTDPTGLYTVSLPNGTYDLDAGFAIGSTLAAAYPTIPFVLSVNGAGGTREISMFPPARTLDIQVVSRASGVSIANAAVDVSGVTRPENVGQLVTGATNVNGSVAIGVFTGIYNVTATATGYLSGTVATDTSLTNATVGLTVELAPIAAAGATGSTSVISPAVGAALAGGVVALAAGVYLITRRLSAAPKGGRAGSTPTVGAG